MTWLLSSGGRRAGLVRILQSTPEDPRGNTVVVVDASELSAAGRLADEFEPVPSIGSPDFLDEVLRIAEKFSVDAIVPTIDPELAVYAASRELFRSHGIDVWVSGPRTVELGWDKWSLYTWLRQVGLPTVPTIERANLGWSPDLSGPVVAKPRHGSASIGLVSARSIAMLDVDRLDASYLVQQEAPGIEVTVDFAIDRRGRFLGAVPRRRLEVRAGEVSKGVTVAIPAVEELVRELARQLPDAYGVLNVQLFYAPTTGELNIIELNPRFGGGYPLSHHAGADFVGALLRSDAGACEPVAWTPGTVMLRFDEAVYYTSPAYAEDPCR